MTQHDFTIADAPGQPVRLDLQGALQALATLSSGAEPGAPLAGMLWLDTSVAPNGQLKMRNLANTTWLPIPAGFPTKASSAETVAGTDDTKFSTPKGIADRDLITARAMRNRMPNGAMQISQENGDTLGTTQNFYPADMWLCSFSGGVHSFQRVVSLTPRKSQRRLRWIVTTALPTLTVGSYIGYFPRIEAAAVTDFLWGTAAAKRAIVRFGFRAPAGTYALGVRNGTGTIQSYIKTFTISAAQANTDTEQLFIIPAPPVVAGAVWPTDNSAGLLITIAFGMGTQYHGVEGWQTGLILSTATCSNGMAVAGNTFEIFDFGVYLDAFNTGIPPLWEMPDEASELLACQRYFCAGLSTQHHGSVGSGLAYFAVAYGPVEMRGTPTFVGVNAAAPALFPTTLVPLASVSLDNRSFREQRTASGTGTGFFWTTWDASARL